MFSLVSEIQFEPSLQATQVPTMLQIHSECLGDSDFS
jgi:hypothetical protein